LVQVVSIEWHRKMLQRMIMAAKVRMNVVLQEVGLDAILCRPCNVSTHRREQWHNTL
jgi:hypothetical protein